MNLKIGGAISKTLGIKVKADSQALDLYRGIRTQLSALLSGIDPKDLATMSLGLSHSLSRYVFENFPLFWELVKDANVAFELSVVSN